MTVQNHFQKAKELQQTGIKIECSQEKDNIRSPNPAFLQEIKSLQDKIDNWFQGERIYTLVDKIGEGFIE